MGQRSHTRDDILKMMPRNNNNAETCSGCSERVRPQAGAVMCVAALHGGFPSFQTGQEIFVKLAFQLVFHRK